jgi:hypothetical protein
MKQDIVFIFFLSLIITLFIFVPNTTFIPDVWYHMLAAKQVLENGFFQLWDLYGFQPIGRPVLYPPLWSALLAIGGALFGLDNVLHFGGVFLFVVFLTVLYVFSSHYWSKTIALVIAFAGTLSIPSTLSLLSLMPAAVVVALAPLLYLSFLENKTKTGVALLAFMLYIHLVFGWLVMLGMVYFTYRHHRDKAQQMWRMFGISILLYSPWLLWLIFNLGAFNLEMFWGSNPMPGWKAFSVLSHYALNLVYFPLALIGIWLTRKWNDEGLKIIRAILIGLLPVVLLYGGRYTWHIMPFMYIFPIVWLAKRTVFKKLRFSFEETPIIIALCSFLIIPLPMFAFASFTNIKEYVTYDWTALDLPFMSLQGFSATEEFKEIVYLAQLTPTNTILVANSPDIGSALAYYTGRGTDYGLFWESSNNTTIKTLIERRETARPMMFVYDNEDIPYTVDKLLTIGQYQVGWRL